MREKYKSFIFRHIIFSHHSINNGEETDER
jgi:hypothetical protein